MSKMNDAGKSNGNGTGKNPNAMPQSQKAPKNARVVKSSAKTGTISRAAARAAVKELIGDR